MNLMNEINESYNYIKSKTKYNPKIGIILGSGVGSLADDIEDAEIYKYKDIPNFPVPTVDGHEGSLIIGKLHGKEVIAMKGRCHYYEGHSMQKITLPIRVMSLLGVETLIVTNCAGQAKPSILPGDLVLITNHINLSGNNPLIGPNLDKFGERFPDLSHPYDKDLRDKAKEIATRFDIDLKEGVYAMFSGPSYETAVETLMASMLGADTVGMSTVPEVIVANHCGIKVLGFSGVPCMASAFSDEVLSHNDALAAFENITKKCSKIINTLIEEL